MAISPHCDKCTNELSEFGAIILGPPNGEGYVKKWHLCVNCYSELEQELK